MQELRKRAAMFIRVEDMRRYQSNAQTPLAHTNIRKPNKEPPQREQNRPMERRPAKFSNCAPLNAPRFGAIAMKIKDLTPNLILMYMMTSLRPGPFADELAMRPP